MIDVIVAVYKGQTATRRCLDSVLGHPQQVPFDVVVVDDACPEPEIVAYLDDLAVRERITLLRNESNVGFVQSANRGMARHPDRDVVLLNSDAEVANDWLDRLHRSARAAPDIGTATPFSNNATICSYPHPGWTGGVPGTAGLAALDHLFATVNAGRTVDLPTAVGFCMYIRRACLDACGLFDAARFGRGYGEENDFSMRAAAAGFRNVLAADVFVYHEGGVSFSEERFERMSAAENLLREAHPDYWRQVQEFVRRDPARPLREAIDAVRVARGGDDSVQVLVERTVQLAQLETLAAREKAAATETLAATEKLAADREGLIGELRQGLAHAETLVAERDAEVAKLRSGLAHAEALAFGRAHELDRIRGTWLWKSMRILLRNRWRPWVRREVGEQPPAISARRPPGTAGWTMRGGRAANRPTVPDPAIAPGVRVRRDGLIFIDETWSPKGITQQFIGDAATYHQRYFDRLDFVELVDTCLTLAGVDRERALRVLDIGSGGGSSVFAACRLLPRSEIYASDISPQLLRMLAALVESRDELHGRVKVYCFDLHQEFFRRDTFDLVLGAAILHHLIDPWAALTHVAESLKPAGKIILVEPLEAGSLVLTSLYGAVLRVLADLGEADGELARLMNALRLDIHSRLGPPVEKPWTKLLDDKWVFDESYLVLLARQLGLSKVEVYPAQADLTHIYEGAFNSLLADSGNQGLAIPDAVKECVREFDRGIDPELKKRLCPTGIIVFTK